MVLARAYVLARAFAQRRGRPDVRHEVPLCREGREVRAEFGQYRRRAVVAYAADLRHVEAAADPREVVFRNALVQEAERPVGLPQVEQMLLPPVAGQLLRNLGLALPAPFVAQLRKGTRIPLPVRDRTEYPTLYLHYTCDFCISHREMFGDYTLPPQLIVPYGSF